MYKRQGHRYTVTGYDTTDWFKIEHNGTVKRIGLKKSAYCQPYVFNFYAEHIIKNILLSESKAGISVAERIINNLRYSDC